jgi:WD40 repeat protein
MSSKPASETASWIPAENEWGLMPQIESDGLVSYVAFSPDGRYALTRNNIWDVASGTPLRQLKCNAPAIFSPDGQYVLAPCEVGAVLWHVETGRQVFQLEHIALARAHIPPRDYAYATNLVFSPDGRYVLTGSGEDSSVCLWDITNGRKLHQVRGLKTPPLFSKISSLAFSPDGAHFFACFLKEAACIWDVDTGREALRLQWKNFGDAILSPDGLRVLTFHHGSNIACLRDAKNGEQISQLKYDWKKRGFFDGIDSATFLPDCRHITASNSSAVWIWEAITGRTLLQFESQPLNKFIAISPDLSRIVFESDKHGVQVFDAATAEEFPRTERSAWGKAVVFSADSKKLLIGEGNKATLWDIDAGKVVCQFGGFSGYTSILRFSPDGSHIISASYFGTGRQLAAHVWDAATGKEVHRQEGYDSHIDVAAFSQDGQRMLTACLCYQIDNGYVRVCDAQTGKKLQELKTQQKVTALAFSPEGQQALVGFYDNTVVLLDIATGKEIFRMEGYTESTPPVKELYPVISLDILIERPERINAVDFSSDGRYVLAGIESWAAKSTVRIESSGHGSRHASGVRCHFVCVWDALTGKKILRLEGHKSRIDRIAFSSATRRILTASDDKTARLWDADTGKELLQLEGDKQRVESATFSADGQIVAGSVYRWDDKTACSIHTTRVWYAATGKKLRQLEGLLATLSPDGKRVLTRVGNAICLWNAESGVEIYRILPYLDGWLVLYPSGHYRCGGVERLALVRGLECRPVDAEFEARWRLRD